MGGPADDLVINLPAAHLAEHLLGSREGVIDTGKRDQPPGLESEEAVEAKCLVGPEFPAIGGVPGVDAGYRDRPEGGDE